MIPFTMNILNYKSGVYTVEYIPVEKEVHHSIKLDIHLDPETLYDRDKIIEKLSLASPQEYWYNQTQAAEVDHDAAASLVNTSHDISSLVPMPVNPVNSFSFQPPVPGDQGPALEQVQMPRQIVVPSTPSGSSSPEEVVSPQEQNVIKLKMLIQQVLQEMAEGTV